MELTLLPGYPRKADAIERGVAVVMLPNGSVVLTRNGVQFGRAAPAGTAVPGGPEIHVELRATGDGTLKGTKLALATVTASSGETLTLYKRRKRRAS